MNKNDLFANQCEICKKIKIAMSNAGYTKFGFSEISGISRPTLDKLLKGEISSPVTLSTHIDKVLKTLNMSINDLLSIEIVTKKTEIVYSENAPIDHEMSDKAKRQYDDILSLINLCEIYYKD